MRRLSPRLWAEDGPRSVRVPVACRIGDLGALYTGRRILHAAGLAFEIGPLLDGQLLMEDVAFELAAGLQQHALAAHRPHHGAAYDDLLGDDIAGDACIFADDDAGGVQVALDLAVDLHLAPGHEVADDRQVGTDL